MSFLVDTLTIETLKQTQKNLFAMTVIDLVFRLKLIEP
jgi:hypothetical protein